MNNKNLLGLGDRLIMRYDCTYFIPISSCMWGQVHRGCTFKVKHVHYWI